jgi:hypothetical protein
VRDPLCKRVVACWRCREQRTRPQRGAPRGAHRTSFGSMPLPNLMARLRAFGGRMTTPGPVRGFVSQDADLLDTAPRLLFLRKLCIGPSLAVEMHARDASMMGQVFVPDPRLPHNLRRPRRINEILFGNPHLSLYIRNMAIFRSHNTTLRMQSGSPFPAVLSMLSACRSSALFQYAGPPVHPHRVQHVRRPPSS